MVYDVVIIGSGGAALSAAIELRTKGKKVICLTKSSVSNAQTAQAQGGINAVMNSEDSIESHIEDTKKSAYGLTNNDNLEYMCNNAKESIIWLDSLGVPFNRNSKKEIDQRRLGGSSFARANYSSDYTGLKILQVLFDKALSLGVEFAENTMLLSLINEDNSIKGVVALDIKNTELKQYLGYNTIVASGGYGGVYHNYTTNSVDTTGDGIVAAYKAGASLQNMEMIQFHPTALVNKFILVSESARSEGGFLVTEKEERFVDELLPRDIVACEIYKKIQNNEQVYLDLRHLGLKKILHLLPQEYKLSLEMLGLKMDKELIPITPACHYTMGGILVDNNSKTSLDNLYAIGECASIGIHGANRLGGNSLLELVVFGRKIAKDLVYDNNVDDKIYPELESEKLSINEIFNKDGKSFYETKSEIGSLMYNKVGLFRDELKLKEANLYISNLLNDYYMFGIDDKSRVFNQNLKHYIEFYNILEVANLISKLALLRDESRGAHTRIDYPNELDVLYNTVSSIDKGVQKVWI